MRDLAPPISEPAELLAVLTQKVGSTLILPLRQSFTEPIIVDGGVAVFDIVPSCITLVDDNKINL